MTAVLMEDDDNLYYSELSFADFNNLNGKCLIFNKNNKVMFEGWIIDNIR